MNDYPKTHTDMGKALKYQSKGLDPHIHLFQQKNSSFY